MKQMFMFIKTAINSLYRR